MASEKIWQHRKYSIFPAAGFGTVNRSGGLQADLWGVWVAGHPTEKGSYIMHVSVQGGLENRK